MEYIFQVSHILQPLIAIIAKILETMKTFVNIARGNVQ